MGVLVAFDGDHMKARALFFDDRAARLLPIPEFPLHPAALLTGK
jgi:hypothetical protein